MSVLSPAASEMAIGTFVALLLLAPVAPFSCPPHAIHPTPSPPYFHELAARASSLSAVAKQSLVKPPLQPAAVASELHRRSRSYHPALLRGHDDAVASLHSILPTYKPKSDLHTHLPPPIPSTHSHHPTLLKAHDLAITSLHSILPPSLHLPPIPSTPSPLSRPPLSPHSLALLGIGFVSICWGLNFPFTKLAMDAASSSSSIPPGAFLTLRFGAAGLLLSPLLLTAKDLPATILNGAEVGGYLALAYLAQAVGLQTETAGEAGFLCSLQVVFVTIASAALARQKIPPKAVVSSLLAVLGVGLLEGGVEGLQSAGPGFLPLLFQPVGFGLTYLKIEKMVAENPQDSAAFTASQLLFCALFCAAYVGGFEGGLDTLLGSAKGLVSDGLTGQSMSVLYTVAFGTIFSILTEVEALKTASPTVRPSEAGGRAGGGVR